METTCTCGISRKPCINAFVYNMHGHSVAEIEIEKTAYLRNGFTALCAGAALQKLNAQISRAHGAA